ncbi:MAG: hypothetical protein JO063_09925 [Pseudonocardiales bacterium]|nr:hypothetical protein [Pseudonocardiales bacterium]MBV9030280.1 hypothetical protein [Pseudonocardiales bacterium]MBW0010415.1 hypothetical protein [Pseudonocardiales bacterium]
MTPADIPRVDQPGPDPRPRAVRFSEAATAVRRRGFLAVVSTAAMTLGITVLSWVPLARPARADQGSEYPGCGRYHYGPHGPICTGAPYSPSYCDSDNWFKNGCFGNWKEGLDCYQPRTICRAGEEARDAWLWKADDTVYRCADGEIHYAGAPNLEQVICNATLSQPAKNPSPLP